MVEKKGKKTITQRRKLINSYISSYVHS